MILHDFDSNSNFFITHFKLINVIDITAAVHMLAATIGFGCCDSMTNINLYPPA
jgi:hypothetical protein